MLALLISKIAILVIEVSDHQVKVGLWTTGYRYRGSQVSAENAFRNAGNWRYRYDTRILALSV